LRKLLYLIFDIPSFKNILKPIHMVFGQKKRVLI
jgi:hypothetical protein